MRHDGVPDLRRAAQVRGGGGAVERAFEGGAEVVGLQLDGGETDRAFGQMSDTTVTGGGIGQGDDTAGVQIAVGGEQRGPWPRPPKPCGPRRRSWNSRP